MHLQDDLGQTGISIIFLIKIYFSCWSLCFHSRHSPGSILLTWFKVAPTLYWACDYLSMLALDLNPVFKKGSWPSCFHCYSALNLMNNHHKPPFEWVIKSHNFLWGSLFIIIINQMLIYLNPVSTTNPGSLLIFSSTTLSSVMYAYTT